VRCQCSNSGRTASCDYQRDGADVISCQGEEEENTIKMLTPWEKELEMLEDWLNHPEPVNDCHEKKVMQMLEEE